MPSGHCRSWRWTMKRRQELRLDSPLPPLPSELNLRGENAVEIPGVGGGAVWDGCRYSIGSNLLVVLKTEKRTDIALWSYLGKMIHVCKYL